MRPSAAFFLENEALLVHFEDFDSQAFEAEELPRAGGPGEFFAGWAGQGGLAQEMPQGVGV